MKQKPTGKQLTFNEHLIYIHNLVNKIKGFNKQLVSNRIEFPPAKQSKNKFKNL